MDREAPEGFEQLGDNLGFIDLLAPVYRRPGPPPTVGMFVLPKHTNLIDICHGGVLMTLGDIAAAWAVNTERGEPLPAPTLNLGFDFISAAREGEWLEAEADQVTVKRRVGFASGFMRSGDRLVCRFSGSFYLPDPGAFKANEERLAGMFASNVSSAGD
ncbi:MAG: PaaI family thioesterase [Halieaceae bacterium]|nr:PaaI family thioesterase [Halieaceae bacterium]